MGCWRVGTDLTSLSVQLSNFVQVALPPPPSNYFDYSFLLRIIYWPSILSGKFNVRACQRMDEGVNRQMTWLARQYRRK